MDEYRRMAAAGCKSVSFASRTVAASYGLHIDKLSVSKEHLETALVTYIIENPSEEWVYNSREENIRSFVKSLPILQEKQKMNLKT